MNWLEAEALGYPALAGKGSPLPICQLLRFDRASSGILSGNGRQFRLDLHVGAGARDWTADSGRLVLEQAPVVATGSRREYSIGQCDGEKGVCVGGFPGMKEISPNNVTVHQ